MTRSRRAKEKGDKRGRRRLTQTTLAGQILEDEDNKYYGDAIGIKKEGIVRIGYQNVNRIPVDGRSGKSRKVVDTIRTGDFDVFGMTEVGLKWSKVDHRDQWHHRVEGKLDQRAIFGYNKHENQWSEQQQWGGTGLVTTDSMQYSMAGSGVDPSGLGRWCWSRYSRGQQVTRVICVYRPGRPRMTSKN